MQTLPPPKRSRKCLHFSYIMTPFNHSLEEANSSSQQSGQKLSDLLRPAYTRPHVPALC